MILPQFSLRLLLLLIGLCGVIGLVLAQAMHGGARWAGAALVGVGSLVLAFGGYAATFACFYALARSREAAAASRNPGRRESTDPAPTAPASSESHPTS